MVNLNGFLNGDFEYGVLKGILNGSFNWGF